MKLVKFDSAGLGVELLDVPADMRVAPDERPISDNGERLALVDGAVTRIWDLRGFSAFGGPQGRTPMRVPNDEAYLGKSWAQLQSMTGGGNAHGIRQVARPETTAERNARQAQEAAAAAEAERVRKANRVVSAVQFRLAANQMGVRSAIEAVVAASQTAQNIKDYWEYETQFRRAHPLWAQVLPLINATESQLDALYDLAETL